VARGTLDQRVVEQMHAHLQRELELDRVMCCYHDDVHACTCRKPQPGMLVDAAEQLGVLLQDSFIVGDRWRDVEAGKRAGCTTILLNKPYSGSKEHADYEVDDLSDAVEIILRRRGERT